MTQKIDGFLFSKMINNALANLAISEEAINDLNVFPVADGDTGSNMRLTLQNGANASEEQAHLGEFAKKLSEGMLLGARGNSGVILSQLFRGIGNTLENCEAAEAGLLREAFICGYKTAYEAVVSPVEGTILTVAREGIENISLEISDTTSVEEFFAVFIEEMKKSLQRTPELLAVLKEYDVVDSGAVGYITIIEGMYKSLYGECIESEHSNVNYNKVNISEEIFNENSVFEEGYCTEFILQLMRADSYNQKFSLEEYIETLKTFGNSIVATKEGKRVKVHIHTLQPYRVMEYTQQFGEFLTFKLENMQIQANEFVSKRSKKKVTKPHTEMAVVAVVNGEGMKGIYSDFGCSVIIDGSSKMNTSTEEFLEAIKEANADKVVVLPNNSNNIPAAELARDMIPEVEVIILPTASMVEGYYALSMDIPDDAVDKRIKAMSEGAGNITTIAETIASKDYEAEGIQCKTGDEIALINGKVVSSGENYLEVILGSLALVSDIEDKEFCVIFRGKGISSELEEQIEEALSESYPMLELLFMDGGQSVYKWLLGLF